MSPSLIALIIVLYFVGLLFISFLTTRKVNSQSFYNGNRNSPWYVIAIGMVGSSISGITVISVPGWVLTKQFGYMQMVLGFMLGYIIVANVLLPLYYRLNLTSIYEYLSGRFGKWSYKTGASFFLISRMVSSAFRLYLVSMVIQTLVLDSLGVPFWITVSATVLIIWLYTYKGGMKTIIWTDLIQTASMLITLVLSVVLVKNSLGFSFGEMVDAIKQSGYSKMWFFDSYKESSYFWKQFLAGAFTTIVMTGLDQDMMQKNLSCRNLKEAKINMYSYGFLFLPINLLFLSLGALLAIYMKSHGLDFPAKSDSLFPMLATGSYFNPVLGIFFIIGVISASYSSADSALASLTTSFTIDILGGDKMEESKLRRVRNIVHIGMSATLILVILVFRMVNNDSVISAIFTMVGYTYGPLLGLFAFGLFTKLNVRDKAIPFIAVVAPILSYIVSINSKRWFGGYEIGFELLIINGMIMFAGMLMFSRKRPADVNR